MSASTLMITEYPKAVLKDIRKGKKITLVEFAKIGMVISVTATEEESYQDGEFIIREYMKTVTEHPLIVIDLEELEKKFQRKIDVWKNSGKETLGLHDSLEIMTWICLILAPLRKPDDLGRYHFLYSDGVKYTMINPSGEIHFGLFATHPDLIHGKITEYWQHRQSELRQKLLKPKKINNIKPLPKAIRYEVLKYHEFKCAWCGKSQKEISLEIDHIIPRSHGGPDEISNLRVLCVDCNRNRGNTLQGMNP